MIYLFGQKNQFLNLLYFFLILLFEANTDKLQRMCRGVVK